MNILEHIKRDMREKVEAHLCISWATIMPSRADDIRRWCKILNVSPHMIYAYTWQDEDFFFIPEEFLIRDTSIMP